MSLLPDWVEEPARKVSLFLEVEAASIPHLNAICSPEYGRSMKGVLELQSFNGADVRFATHPYIPPAGDLCVIPHFGHDISCGEGCVIKSGEPRVYRLFEVEAFVDDKSNSDLFGRYQVAEHIEVSVSGRGGIVDLTSVPGFEDDDRVPVGYIGRDYSPESDTSERLDERTTSMGIGGEKSYQGQITGF